MDNNKKAKQASYYSIFTNTALAIIKGITGILGNSFALIADAIESTTDIIASLFVLLGLKYAEKPPDENHPYGHGKIEPLVTFIVVAFLVLSAAFIAFESIHNIQSPQESPAPWTLIVLGIIIISKELSYQYVNKKGKETHSTSLQADAWHHRSDAITSLIAFIGILIAIVMGNGYETADDWAALIAAFFILYNSYKIFRPALGEIMDEHQYDDIIEVIREKSVEIPGIIDTEKCYIRKSGMNYQVDLHATVDGNISVTEGHDIAHELQDHLKKEIPNLAYILIHIEPDGME